MIEIVPAQLEHVIELCEHLRAHEREKFEKFRFAPEKTVTREVARSILAFAGLKDGRTGAIWGIKAAPLGDEAYIWLICTTLVEQNPITFLRHSRRVVNDLRQVFPRLRGHVFCDFEASVRWLRWLGCDVESPVGELSSFEVSHGT